MTESPNGKPIQEADLGSPSGLVTVWRELANEHRALQALERTYRKGETIVQQGQAHQQAFIVLEGHVRVYIGISEDDPERNFSIFDVTCGDLGFEQAFYESPETPARCSFRATAEEDTVIGFVDPIWVSRLGLATPEGSIVSARLERAYVRFAATIAMIVEIRTERLTEYSHAKDVQDRNATLAKDVAELRERIRLMTISHHELLRELSETSTNRIENPADQQQEDAEMAEEASQQTEDPVDRTVDPETDEMVDRLFIGLTEESRKPRLVYSAPRKPHVEEINIPLQTQPDNTLEANEDITCEDVDPNAPREGEERITVAFGVKPSATTPPPSDPDNPQRDPEYPRINIPSEPEAASASHTLAPTDLFDAGDIDETDGTQSLPSYRPGPNSVPPMGVFIPKPGDIVTIPDDEVTELGDDNVEDLEIGDDLVADLDANRELLYRPRKPGERTTLMVGVAPPHIFEEADPDRNMEKAPASRSALVTVPSGVAKNA